MLLAERVFEQQRVGIELLLQFGEFERLWLDERGVMRIGFANLDLRSLLIVFKLADLFLSGSGLFGSIG
ncbi:MAG: hypothetical protein IPL01_10410 [Acidobacteria bacterium]|nr:hypothetical protein [Acidobacteriota bacterium]